MPRIEAPTVAEHNAMRRRQVIEAAADELRDGGLAAFTPAAVAKRAGLARSSMYQYYPSTDALLGAAISTLLQRSRDRVIAAVDTAETPAERVSAYIRAAIADARDGHGAALEISGIAMPEVCREGVRVLHEQLREPLLSALRDADIPDPQTLAVLVQGLVNAASRAAAHGASLERIEAGTIDLVLRGAGLLAPANAD